MSKTSPAVELGNHIAEHRQFALKLARPTANSQVQHGSHRQRKQHPNACQRKAHAGGLGATLRIGRLVLRGVGHRDRRTVEELDGSPQPTPRSERRPIRRRSRVSHQHRQQGFGKTLPSAGIAAGVGRTGGHSLPQPPSEETLHGRRQGGIGMDHLAEKQPQHRDRIVKRVVAMQPQRFQRRRYHLSRQYLGKRQAGMLSKLASEPIDLSLKRPSGTITHGGLLAAWGVLTTPL